MSLILAVAITAPALVILTAMGATRATIIPALVPTFLIWFVGGGVLRTREARRESLPE